MAIRRLRSRRFNVTTLSVPAAPPASSSSAPHAYHPTLPAPERAAPLRGPPAPERTPAVPSGAVDGVLGTAYSVFDDYLAEGRRFAKRQEQGGAPSWTTEAMPAPPPMANVPADVSSVLARLARDIMGSASGSPRPGPPDQRTRFAFEPGGDDESQDSTYPLDLGSPFLSAEPINVELSNLRARGTTADHGDRFAVRQPKYEAKQQSPDPSGKHRA